MSTGQIVPLKQLSGENSSYTLAFPAPRISCNTTLDKVEIFGEDWRPIMLVSKISLWNTTRNRVMGFYPSEVESQSGLLGRTVMVVLERETTLCETYIATYKVAIDYISGSQVVRYTVGDMEKFVPFGNYEYSRDDFTETDVVTADTEKYLAFESEFLRWIANCNYRAIVGSIGFHFNHEYSETYGMTTDYGLTYEKAGPYLLPNGSEVELYSMPPSQGEYSDTFLQDTVLNTNRLGDYDPANYDPRLLNISEASTNELIANLTISSLTLNTWYGNVSVNDTRYTNIYRFSHPLDFFLPYGISLGLTAVFIGFAMFALRENGTSAIDGGFLQVMMTTCGDTRMHQQVNGGSVDGSRNAPKDLLELEVRFGELTDSTTISSGRYGFGTEEETVALNRRL